VIGQAGLEIVNAATGCRDGTCRGAAETVVFRIKGDKKMEFRLSQIPYLVEQGQLPNWVTEQLDEKWDATQEALDYERTVTILGSKGDGSLRVARG
jgi:hypothetical protein